MTSFKEEIDDAMRDIAFGVKEVGYSKWHDPSFKDPLAHMKVVTLEGQTLTVLGSLQGYNTHT